MRYFYDTEFLERGSLYPISLISIGIVAEDGREYYAVNSLAPWEEIAAHKWLMENVVPSLPMRNNSMFHGIDFDHPDVKSPNKIAREVLKFLLAGTGQPELWAWYGAYDHVLFAQLFGRMIDFPSGQVPMWTNDLRQLQHELKVGLPEQPSGAHNALEDARFNKVRYELLRGMEYEQLSRG